MLSHDEYAAHDAVGLAALVRDGQATSADLVAGLDGVASAEVAGPGFINVRLDAAAAAPAA